MLEASPQLRGATARSLAPALLCVLATAPVIYMAFTAVLTSRNLVFWDDVECVLDFLLQLHRAHRWDEFFRQLFVESNEHRMVTSRTIFAVGYWLTGSVNFHVLGALGNLFLFIFGGLLVASARAFEQRVRMAVVVGLVVFNLEHFENLTWSGASIDHYQVVMWVAATLYALGRGTRPWLLAAVVAAILATFTLAHGLLAWPAGALLLWQTERRRELGFWCALAALVGAGFLFEFEIYSHHRVEYFSLAGAGRIVRYWLALLGSPVVLGGTTGAPLFGAALLFLLGGLSSRRLGLWAKAPVALALAWFGVAALAAVAVGRVAVSAELVNSRYLVLGELAWAMAIFLLLELRSREARPYRALGYALPALVAFNVLADWKLQPMVDHFVAARESAALNFAQEGVDGRGPVSLFPVQGRAEQILPVAAKAGVYKLPLYSELETVPALKASARIAVAVDDVRINRRSIAVTGWAALPNTASHRGQVHILLRSPTITRVYTTLPMRRPDVAAAEHEPRWMLSGYRFILPRDDLPPDDYTVGIVVDPKNGPPEYVLTARHLRIDPVGGHGALAEGQ